MTIGVEETTKILKEKYMKCLNYKLIALAITVFSVAIGAKDCTYFDKFRGHSLIISNGHEKSVALNPTTGNPYVFWFVNNKNSRPNADGTFKNPFPTLADAQNLSNQNDVIYVFCGDGTDKGMNTGFVLKVGQQFLGAGIKQLLETTLGCIKIPAQEKCCKPVVSNTQAPAPFAAITAPLNPLAGNNVISGFDFVDNIGGGTGGSNVSACIRIEAGLNFVIKHNNMSTASIILPGGGNCLNIYGGGNMKIVKNKFIGRDAGDIFGVDMVAFVSPYTGTFEFTKNLFTGADSQSGLVQGAHVEIGDDHGVTGPVEVLFLCNTSNPGANSSDDGPRGFSVANRGPDLVTAILKGNHITIPSTFVCTSHATPPLPSSCAGISINGFGPGLMFANLSHNNVITTGATPGYLFNNKTSNTSSQAFVLQIEFDDNKGTVQIL